MKALPELHTLSDEALDMLPKQIMDMTLETLDGFAAEMQAGNLTLEQANAKSDEVMHWITAQQAIFADERVRRAQIGHRKKKIMKLAVLAVAAIAVLAVVLLK